MSHVFRQRWKKEYDNLYKAAFKEAVALVAGTVAGKHPAEPVKGICDRLNLNYGLVIGPGKKKVLTRTTIYQATRKDGMIGQSPNKRGPPSVIPDALVSTIATHSQVCQVGDGELSGTHMQHLIGASLLGTQYENRFKVESVWKKLKTHHPEALQAA